jgi:hypothetical protein
MSAEKGTLIESGVNKDPIKSVFGNGLLPIAKPHTAIPQKMKTTVAAFRWLPRKPAHIKGSKMRNPSRLR